MSKELRTSQSLPALGSLAGYAMSDSDDEAGDGDMHKLSGNISGSDEENSPHSQPPSRTYSPVIKDDDLSEKKKLPVSSLGLVSYGGNEEDDSDQEMKQSDNEEEIKTPSSSGSAQNDGVVESTDNADLAEDPTNNTNTPNGMATAPPENDDDMDVVIPPSPPGPPPQDLIEKISKIYRKGHGYLDDLIQNNKSFRNPSIYEKLLSHVGVNEKGTNYPPELFDPSIWDKNSYYDELAKLQNIEMEKRKAEKKDRVKVDFITATKPSGSADSTEGSAAKKTKWDTGAGTQQAAIAAASTTANPVGSLIKKK